MKPHPVRQVLAVYALAFITIIALLYLLAVLLGGH